MMLGIIFLLLSGIVLTILIIFGSLTVDMKDEGYEDPRVFECANVYEQARIIDYFNDHGFTARGEAEHDGKSGYFVVVYDLR